MGDIVERLRREVPHCDDPSDYGESDLLILKAADEIERLREVLRPFACKCESDWCEKLRFNDDKEKCENYIARTALGEKE